MPFSRNPAEEASLYVMHFQAGGGNTRRARGARHSQGMQRKRNTIRRFHSVIQLSCPPSPILVFDSRAPRTIACLKTQTNDACSAAGYLRRAQVTQVRSSIRFHSPMLIFRN